MKRERYFIALTLVYLKEKWRWWLGLRHRSEQFDGLMARKVQTVAGGCKSSSEVGTKGQS